MTVEFSPKGPKIAKLATAIAETPVPPVLDSAPETVDLAVTAVERAANTIEELLTFGQNISDISQRGVSHYRELATAAISRAEVLEQECLDLRKNLTYVHETSSARISELEATVEALNEELEKMRGLIWPKRSPQM